MCIASSISADGIFNSYFFCGIPTARVFTISRDPGYCTEYPVHRIDGCNRPVGAKAHHHPLIQHAFKSICTLESVGIKPLVGPNAIIIQMIRMHGSNHALAGKIGNGLFADMLGMLYPETPVPRTIQLRGIPVNRKDKIIGPVADGMHRNMQAGLVSPCYPFSQEIGICNVQAMRMRIIQIRLMKPCGG